MNADEAVDRPMSFHQERLWFLQRSAAASATYHVTYAVDLTGPIDERRLEAAVAALTERHPAFRTSFVSINGVPVQRVHRHASLPLHRHTVAPELVDSTLVRLAARPFDLGRPPLHRVDLVRYGAHGAVLLLTSHHALIDSHSLAVFGDEIAARYDSATEAAPAPPSTTHDDFVDWQRRYVQTEEFRAGLSFWREVLTPVPERLQLPSDAGAGGPGAGGAVCTLRIEAELRRELSAFGEGERATEFMGLIAALAALLARYTAGEDMVIAMPVDDRPGPEFSDVIGFFVNTLPLRLEVTGEHTFREVIRRARDVTVGALAHRHVPYGHIVQAVNPRRRDGRDPFASVLLGLEPDDPVPDLTGLVARPVLVHTATAKYPLSLVFTPRRDGLDGVLEYDRSLIGDQAAARLARCLIGTLAAGLAEPDVALGRLPLVDPADPALARSASAGATTNWPPANSVVDLVMAQASAQPQQTAIEFDGTVTTYRELDRWSAQLAKRLRAVGARPSTVVAVWLRRGRQLPVALLGVLRSGAAYLPIDPDQPAQLCCALIDEAKPVALIAEDDRAGLVPPSLPVISTHPPGPDDADAGAGPDLPEMAHEAAYVIFTSGSTGPPKGVVMPHGPLINMLLWQAARSACGRGDRTLQFSAPAFDVAFQEIFATWSTGGTLVVPTDDVRRDPRALARFVGHHRIDRIFLPFVALNELAFELAQVAGRGPSEVITSGEPLRVTPALVAAARAHGFTVDNQYGPAETHVVTAHLLTGDPDQWEPLPPIGRPIANAKVYLLDDAERPVPMGFPGELYLGGVAIARGYLADDAQTRDRFRPDPFGPPGARMYRSGDVGRHRPDGTIEFLGRRDRQVKIRGHRVELGAIEVTLCQHPAVADAIVDSVAGPGGVSSDSWLVAFLVRGPGASPGAAELARFLGERLPSHMVPTRWRWVEELPRTGTGKVDRRRLAGLAATELAAPRPAALAPETAVETVVYEAFADCLPRPPESVTDSFFALGGHSVLAARLAALLRHRLGRELDTADVFLAPTPRELAAVAVQRPALRPDQQPRRPAATPRERLPVTIAQEHTLRARASAAGDLVAAFNLPVYAFRVTGVVDAALLGDCLDTLVERHEALRAVFTRADGVFGQEIRRRARVHVDHLVPATRGRPGEAVDLALDHARGLAERSFRLDEAPRLRIVYTDVGPEDSVLAFIFDHLTADDAAARIFLDDLGALYRARLADPDSEVPDPAVSYRDFVLWDQGGFTAPEAHFAADLDHWASVLAPEHVVPEVSLPFLKRGGWVVGAGLTMTTPPRTDLREQVRGVCSREAVTPFVVVATAVQVVLLRCTGRPTALMSPVANRDEPDWERLVGYLSHPVIVRPGVAAGDTLRQSLHRLRDITNRDRRHYRLPYFVLQRRLAPERFGHDRSAPNAVVNVMTPTPELQLGPAVARPLEVPETLATVPSIAITAIVADALALTLTAPQCLLEAAHAQALLDDVATVIELIATGPDAQVDDLRLRTARR